MQSYLVYKASKQKNTLLIVYFDDIVVIRDDATETWQLKTDLPKEFDIKDLGP